MRVAVPAVQGAFAEQIAYFKAAGADAFEVRNLRDWENARADALVLPGGESTVQRKLIRSTGLFEPLEEAIARGMPVFATCAGAILLARKIEGEEPFFGALDIEIRRNGYGRQNESFSTSCTVWGIDDFPATFIRAPTISAIGKDVEVVARCNGMPTGVKCARIIALAWHPELSRDLRLGRKFLEMAAG
ncbi:MAG: pyridoxal 5'-phosphate synthase glutaminase subunit PdxT [Kiritimatiellae bacterium]|nr:pyridoxal 5'-phosphate synthase glutaminase subunit PdxT [Kiritimatiellia bacterium]